MVAKKKVDKKKQEKPGNKVTPKEKGNKPKERPPASKRSTVKEISVSAGRVSAKLCDVRFDWVSLKAPRKNNFGSYQYSLRIGFFGELADYLYEPIKEAILKGAPKKWSENKMIAIPEKDMERLRKNAIEKLAEKLSKEGEDHFAEAYVLNASAVAEKTGERTFKPKTPIFITPNPDAIYSGCWGDVSVTFAFHANDGGGVTVYLNGVRFTGDDVKLAGVAASNPWDEEAETVGEATVEDFDGEDNSSSSEPEDVAEPSSEDTKKKKRFW